MSMQIGKRFDAEQINLPLQFQKKCRIGRMRQECSVLSRSLYLVRRKIRAVSGPVTRKLRAERFEMFIWRNSLKMLQYQ